MNIIYTIWIHARKNKFQDTRPNLTPPPRNKAPNTNLVNPNNAISLPSSDFLKYLM